MNNERPTGKTPVEFGYRMPAEWEEHDAIWLAWPHDPQTFPERIRKVENVYLKIIGSIYESEEVNLFVKDEGMKARVLKLLERNAIYPGNINFIIFDYADVWFRDYGPIFVTDKNKNKLVMLHWIYNAWGRKYERLMKDTRIPSIINQRLRLDCFEPSIVLEGGSIDVNGKGTLITTEQCLLNKNRNPHLDRKEIENYLEQYLGVSHIIWLKNGIAGDDTDGHVDDIARFVNPTTVLCAYEEDEKDENFLVLKENYEILLGSVDQDGNPLNVVKLPMPGYVGDKHSRLPASYANFYIGNRAVLVPIFRHMNDEAALDIIRKFFPDRNLIGIDCTDLVYGLGTIHCISQQQPAVKPQ